MNLLSFARLTESEARAHVEQLLLWRDGGLCCPRCSSKNAFALSGKAAERGIYRCRDCKKDFTVRTGTILAGSHQSYGNWLYVMSRMAGTSKGISAKQVAKDLGIGYRSAWHMCHRIREAMRALDATKLEGIVEVDEAYCGSRRRKDGFKNKRGRGTTMQPVIGALARDGNVRTRVVSDVTKKSIHKFVLETVDPKSTLMTDEFQSYSGLNAKFEGGHHVVRHGEKEYALPGGINSNTIESFFSTIKKPIRATFHSVTPKHLQRYMYEFEYRWNHRKLDPVDSVNNLITQCPRKSLTFRSLVATPVPPRFVNSYARKQQREPRKEREGEFLWTTATPIKRGRKPRSKENAL